MHLHPDIVLADHMYDINILGFKALYNVHIIPSLEVSLARYNIHIADKSTLKRLIFHHVIFTVCESIKTLSENGTKAVVLYCHETDFGTATQIKGLEAYDIDAITKLLLKKIAKILPIKMYTSKTLTFEQLGTRSWQNGQVIGERECIRTVADRDFSGFTYSAAINFVTKNALTFLTHGYFQNLKTKRLILR